jgi:tetratricopeptide (TPR) repeat protein
MIRAGVANVLGWGGSVVDDDARAFARTFYGELAERQRVARAAAVARQALRTQALKDGARGSHWHLARLYLGPGGGGTMARKGLPKRKLAGAGFEEQFLDPARSEVPVASRAEFVGRRRDAQRVLRAFESGAAGVLIHGMGNLGKSSLAARVASRMASHQTVVVFGRYDAPAILDRVIDALPPAARADVRAAWRDAVLADSAALADALEDLLTGALDERPILLIVDDLERILQPPREDEPATTVQERFRVPLAAVLRAFAKARSATSRLLLTSRYRFTLPDGRGADLAAALQCVPLRPMDDADRTKQLRAAARVAGHEAFSAEESAWVQRALDVAAGNPGLQALLTRPLLKGEQAAAGAAIEAIEHFRRTGVAPEDIRRQLDAGAAKDPANAALAFFRRMAFDTYRAALSAPQATLLRAGCLFSAGLPVPRQAIEAAGEALGVSEPGKALDRLLALGLADDWGTIDGHAHAAVNPLARPLAGELDSGLFAHLAGQAVPQLAQAWQHADGTIAQGRAAVELARLALVATETPPALLDQAANAAARHLFHAGYDARRAYEQVLQPALDRLRSVGAVPSLELLLITADCAELLGKADVQDEALQRLDESSSGTDRARVLLRRARREAETGLPDQALRALAEAHRHFADAGQEGYAAQARGNVADILQARGQLDEALRIRVEEELPVYERLGDVRSKAVTQGRIAGILKARGQFDEALRKLREDVLPAFERLGDVRSKAVTQGRIADILQARGQLDEALRIRVEEELPVYGRLGDVRSKALTQGKIADILQARGQLDEALRIRMEEELPVYERLGDVHSKAVTQGQIADIQQARGQLDEALALHQQRLPVAERMHDIDSLAHIRYRMAAIRLLRGDHQKGGLALIRDDLNEAYRLVVQLDRPDAIGAIGELLAQVMALGADTTAAMETLTQVEQAYRRLNNTVAVNRVQALRQSITSSD